MRVASLLPSSTEIACAVGARSQLVARSHECDFPADVASLPPLTSARIDPEVPSFEIDRDVRALLAQGLSIYNVDAERLRELAPEVILTQTLCEVCAITPRDLEQALADWTGVAPQLVSLEPLRLEDVWSDIERVGTALGLAREGQQLADGLRARVESLAEQIAGVAERPSVATLEWINPLMAAGNWMPELVELAGGRNLFGLAGEHSPWLEWEALQKSDPELLLVLPCGFGLERTRAELGPLLEQTGFAELDCARSGRIYLLEGNQFFNRPGPRLAESLEILCEVLHPLSFDFGHSGTGWQSL